MTIDEMTRRDWPAAAEIYAEGIATGSATFETEVPTWGRFDATHLPAPRPVVREDGRVVAWAAVARVSDREVFAGRVECSLYVGAAARGGGIGEALMAELVARCDAAGIWTMEATVLPENAASVAMLEANGFRVVGRRERIARRDGRWRDALLLERRGPVA
ncbi:MAG: N-acetyltransferase family protein [Thermoleophilia bacterium]